MSRIYISEDEKRIYIDNSTRTVLQVCKEKARLGNVLGYRTIDKSGMGALDFGHAFHAAVAAYYDWQAGGWFDEVGNWHKIWQLHVSATRTAQAAFMGDIHAQGSQMAISLEDAEDKRSVERGVALVEAYIERWKNEPYENILDKDGQPLTEIYFEVPVAQWGEWTIVYCGTIDRIMMNILTKRPVIFETKTTSKGLSVFVQEAKPNQQIDGYFKIAWALMKDMFPELPEIKQAVWDCIFVSKRQPDMNKALKDRFRMYGIDAKADFARQETTRSVEDVMEFMVDIEADAVEFAKWLMSNAPRWPRAKHSTSCHLFGGCPFRLVCSTNGAPEMLTTFFEVKPWNPRKKLRQL